MTKLNAMIRNKGYYIKKRNTNVYSLHVSTIVTGVNMVYAVYECKTLREMESFVNKKILNLDDIVVGAEYTVLNGIVHIKG